MLIQADARALPLADACVDCVVTSPPYFGLRDYGSRAQIGLEANPLTYVQTLVGVFDEVWRVLKPEGVVWLNLGDSYGGAGTIGRNDTTPEALARRAERFGTGTGAGSAVGSHWQRPKVQSLKSKDLIGIPWRVAFALQADGWYLRSDIIWSKPNPMPESVTDRPTKAHEYLFLLSKQERYHYDADAIREQATCLPSPETSRNNNGTKSSRVLQGGLATSTLGWNRPEAGRNKRSVWTVPEYHGQATKDYDSAGAQNPSDTKRRILAAMADPDYAGRNKHSVWTINTQPYAGAHFATMPEALVEPCILAGCPMGGLVLDPFSGSGTVLAVAERLGRRGVGVDLNPAYHQLAKVRTAQRGLRFGSPEADPAVAGDAN